jgi:MoaA/NifB/PqqE/SkfB family radical SAM enzyme
MLQHPIELVHLQLSLRCNLRCSFCGQWGKHGFASRQRAKELTAPEWLDAIRQIDNLNSPAHADYNLWGGEPLLSPAFPAVAEYLRSSGHRTAVVTNGSLLRDFADVVNKNINTLYVSLDGPPEVHEKLRNRPGLFEEVNRGLSLIDHERVKVVGLFTLCEGNYHAAAAFPFLAAELGVNKLIYQNLIYCSGAQAAEYRRWLQTDFSLSAENVDSWVTESFGDWITQLPAVCAEIEDNIADQCYPLEVMVHPSEWHSGNIKDWYQPDVSTGDRHCNLPWSHLHLRPGGEVDFCVDHNDFSLGNIRIAPLAELLTNPAAEKFRAGIKTGRNPLCRRCPWHYNRGKLSID